MTHEYPFIAFCSAVLNSKTTRKAFLDPKKQSELFTKFALTPAQKKIAKSMDIELLNKELSKELAKAVKDASKGSETALCW